jgi:hypothetical protein
MQNELIPIGVFFLTLVVDFSFMMVTLFMEARHSRYYNTSVDWNGDVTALTPLFESLVTKLRENRILGRVNKKWKVAWKIFTALRLSVALVMWYMSFIQAMSGGPDLSSFATFLFHDIMTSQWVSKFGTILCTTDLFTQDCQIDNTTSKQVALQLYHVLMIFGALPVLLHLVFGYGFVLCAAWPYLYLYIFPFYLGFVIVDLCQQSLGERWDRFEQDSIAFNFFLMSCCSLLFHMYVFFAIPGLSLYGFIFPQTSYQEGFAFSIPLRPTMREWIIHEWTQLRGIL